MVNRKHVSAKCIFAAVSSLFLSRFFIVLPTRTSAYSFMLRSPWDSVLFQVNEDKGELTGWDQPVQDASIIQTSALHPSVCVFSFWLFRKYHRNTTLPSAKRVKDRQERSLLPTQTLGDLLGDTRNPSPLCWGEGAQAIERAAGFANHHSPASAVVGQFPFCIAGPRPLLLPQTWGLGTI